MEDCQGFGECISENRSKDDPSENSPYILAELREPATVATARGRLALVLRRLMLVPSEHHIDSTL